VENRSSGVGNSASIVALTYSPTQAKGNPGHFPVKIGVGVRRADGIDELGHHVIQSRRTGKRSSVMRVELSFRKFLQPRLSNPRGIGSQRDVLSRRVLANARTLLH